MVMARARKRHAQTEMTFRTWGGARPGAGRKPNGARAGEKHGKRPRLVPSQPVHVTLRVENDVSRLRTRDMYRSIRYATLAVAERDDFRICHLSIQHGHLHLIAEADGRTPLSNGIRAFEISAAKHINAAASKGRRQKRCGRVFADRYHARVLNSPKSVRNAIRYVVNNWRKHREDRRPFARGWLVDPFSSGIRFSGWRELEDQLWMWQPSSPDYQALWVWQPKTWLLRLGWRRAGPISVLDVPAEAAA